MAFREPADERHVPANQRFKHEISFHRTGEDVLRGGCAEMCYGTCSCMPCVCAPCFQLCMTHEREEDVAVDICGPWRCRNGSCCCMSPRKCCHWYWGGCCFSACDSQHGLFRVSHSPGRPWCCEDTSDITDCACFDADETTRACKMCDACCGLGLGCYCVQPWCWCCGCWGTICAGWGDSWSENPKRWAVQNGARRDAKGAERQKCPHCGARFEGVHQCSTGLVEVSTKDKKDTRSVIQAGTVSTKDKTDKKGVTLQAGTVDKKHKIGGTPQAGTVQKGTNKRLDVNGFQISDPAPAPLHASKSSQRTTQNFDGQSDGGGMGAAAPAPAAPSCAKMERSAGRSPGGRCARCKCKTCRCSTPLKGSSAEKGARAERAAASPNARKSRRDEDGRPNLARQGSSWFRAERTKQFGFI
jgi:hypothetical protein